MSMHKTVYMQITIDYSLLSATHQYEHLTQSLFFSSFIFPFPAFSNYPHFKTIPWFNNHYKKRIKHCLLLIEVLDIFVQTTCLLIACLV